jgi:hypothetical protein
LLPTIVEEMLTPLSTTVGSHRALGEAQRRAPLSRLHFNFLLMS